MNYTLKPGEINYLDEIKAHYARVGLTPTDYTFEVIQGRGRYNKIVAEAPGTRHAAAFIDKTTGHMFKAASWSAPAKTRIV